MSEREDDRQNGDSPTEWDDLSQAAGVDETKQDDEIAPEVRLKMGEALTRSGFSEIEGLRNLVCQRQTEKQVLVERLKNELDPVLWTDLAGEISKKIEEIMGLEQSIKDRVRHLINTALIARYVAENPDFRKSRDYQKWRNERREDYDVAYNLIYESAYFGYNAQRAQRVWDGRVSFKEAVRQWQEDIRNTDSIPGFLTESQENLLAIYQEALHTIQYYDCGDFFRSDNGRNLDISADESISFGAEVTYVLRQTRRWRETINIDDMQQMVNEYLESFGPQ